jgi:hypothetical protein
MLVSFPSQPDKKFGVPIIGLPDGPNLVGRALLDQILFVYYGSDANPAALTDKLISEVFPASLTFGSV